MPRTPDQPPAPATTAPMAHRGRRPGWRDPRLAVGAALVGASVIAGTLVVRGAEDSTTVWAAARDVAAGQALTEADLVPRRVHFADTEVADAYVPAGDGIGDGMVAGRSLSKGELLPGAAVVDAEEVDLVELPVTVEPGAIPPGLRGGATVDVWLVPARGTTGEETNPATRSLEGVRVLSVGGAGDSLVAQRERHLLLGVPAGEQRAIADFLGALGDSRVVLTRKS